MVARRLPILLGHNFLNLIIGNRSEIVAIDADVQREGCGVIFEIAVRVAVKAPSPVMGGIPGSQSIMEQDNFLNLITALLNFKKVIVFDPLEVFQRHSLVEAFIVISSDEILLSLEALQDELCLLRPHEGEISDDMNLVPIRNGMIPIINKRLVHLLHSLEGAIAIFNHVLVAEMKIGGEKDFRRHIDQLFFQDELRGCGTSAIPP